MYKHILIPTDGSELSRAAVSGALGLARALGARVTGFHVILGNETVKVLTHSSIPVLVHRSRATPRRAANRRGPR